MNEQRRPRVVSFVGWRSLVYRLSTIETTAERLRLILEDVLRGSWTPESQSHSPDVVNVESSTVKYLQYVELDVM